MALLNVYEKIQLKIGKMRQKIKDASKSENYILKVFEYAKLVFWEIIRFLVRVFALLFGDSSENFLIFTRLGKNSIFVCNNSFCKYKKMEKKVKFLSKTAFVLVLISTILTSSILYFLMPKPGIKAATINWIQSSWAGGPSALTAKDPDDRTTWTNYADSPAADPNIAAGTAVTLAPIAGSNTETADTDFNGKSTTDNTFAGGSTSSTTVSSNTVTITSSARPDAPSTTNLTDLSNSTDCTNAAGSLGTGSVVSGKCNLTYSATGTLVIGAHIPTGKIGFYNVGTFTINSGVTITLPAYDGSNGGRFYVSADTININGVLDGNAKGYAGGSNFGGAGTGPGAGGGPSAPSGSYDAAGGGGAGYAAVGGAGGKTGAAVGGAGGSVYGNLNDANIDMGSGGAGGCYWYNGSSVCGIYGNAGSAGGGVIYLYASGGATISGTVSVNGGTVEYVKQNGGGGGTGGGILINGNNVTASGVIRANGASGGTGGSGTGGGSGGSGRIKLFASSAPTTAGATITATGYNTSYSGCSSGSIYCSQTSYPANGTFTSRVFDLGANQNFGKLTWTATTPGDSSVTMQVRSGNLNPPTDGTWTSVANGGSLYGFNSKQYIQYKATLNSTSDNTQTPTLSEVKIYYESTWNNAAVNAADVKLPVTTSFTDVDNNTYNLVTIGTQSWFATNLKVTKNPSGGAITHYCYDNDTNLCNTEGGLYDWATIMNGSASCNGTGASQPQCSTPVQGICPVGSHIPSHYEWTLLEKNVGSNPGAFPYDTTTGGWLGTNEGTNLKSGGSSGFNGILAGYRMASESLFTNRGMNALFWSSSESGSDAWMRNLSSAYSTVYRYKYDKADGMSVRCLKNAAGITGTFTSQIINTGQKNASWGNAAWSAATSKPTNTDMTLKVRSCDDSACSGETAFSGITQSITMTNGAGSSALSSLSSLAVGHQYVQYQVTLTSSDGLSTPTFSDLTINYNYYSTSQTLTSSAYDTNDDGVVINSISWAETAPSGTNIKFQIRTGPNSGTAPDWTSSKWCGPSTCAATASVTDYASDWYETTPTGETVNSTQRDSSNDRWIQYKVWLVTSDNSLTPILSNVNIQYVSNSSPCLGTVAGVPPVCGTQPIIRATQDTDGKITVQGSLNGGTTYTSSYPVSDNEEGTGSGKDLDGKVSIQYFYDVGITLTNGPLGTGATSLTVSDPNIVLPATGTIMIDNNLDTTNEKVEVISYTTKTGTTSATLSILTRQTWPPQTGDAGYTTQKTTHTNSSKIWLWAPSATAKGEVSGVSASPKTISTSSLTLSPSSDLASPVFLNNTAKIRIAVNDGNAANQIGKIDSSTFTIDTKNPAGALPAIVNSTISSPTANLTLSVTDDSTYQMRFANAVNQTTPDCATDLYNKTETQIAYQTYAASYAFYPLAPDANGVAAVCYEFKDVYNNKLQGSASTPRTPASIQLADISYAPAALSKWRNLIWWTAQGGGVTYKIYRDSGSGYALLNNVTDPVNYCFDEGDGDCADNSNGALSTTTTTYTYKVLAQKTDGVSAYSSTISGIPNGSTTGETDTTAPTLSSGPSPDSGADSGSQTSATITWTTNEASYSLVRYGATTALGSIAGSATESVVSHSVALAGLTSGTTYYYQILSADSVGNLLQNPTSPPTGLHTFTTTTDSTAPAISAGPTATAGRTSATIYWQTGEDSDSRVKYIVAVDATTNPAGGTSTTLQTEKVLNHYVVITGLAENTTYNYQVISSDSASVPNTLTSPSVAPFLQFTTQASKTDEAAPSITVGPSATPGLTSANIAWTTNESSYSLVEYGTTTSYGFIKGSVLIADYTINHSVNLTNLSSGTFYYYRVHSEDSSGNLATSSQASFTTTADTTAPVISAVTVASADRSSGVITWNTSEDATSRVEYGTASDLAGSSFTTLQSENVTNHITAITGLTPDTTYYYRVHSSDAAGNPSQSSIGNFETISGTKPVITFNETAQGPAVKGLTSSTASVEFSANAISFFSVIYKASATEPASYTSEYGSPSLVTANTPTTLTVPGLSENTKYYYKLKARDIYGNTGQTSSAYSFTTTTDTTAPVITFNSTTGVTVADSTATIVWTTNEAATSRVNYGTNITYSATGSPATNANYNINHSITLTGLSPTTLYYFKITAVDNSISANSASIDNSGAGYTFRTLASNDTTPPTITLVANGTPTHNSAVITWITDENASSLVDFGTSISYGTTQGNSSDSTISHSVTLIGLASSTIYYYRVKSLDAAGNVRTNDNSGAGYTFTTSAAPDPGDVTAPVISLVSSSAVTSTSATVSWTTNENSDSIVGFGLNSASFASEQGLSTLTMSHSVALVNLAPSTTYYYRVKSRDNNGNLATDSSSGAGYTLTTLAGGDSLPPVISAVSITNITSSTATITWTTNENANSLIDYSKTSGVFTSTGGKYQDNTISHSVTLTGLDPETAYYLQTRSEDPSGNQGKDSNGGAGYTFTTIAGSDSTPPVITNVLTGTPTYNSATITWTTSELSNSLVDFGTTTSYGITQGNSADSLTSHSVTLTGLAPATAYYYRVKSIDIAGNMATDNNSGASYNFTTAAGLDPGDTTVPINPNLVRLTLAY